jgi:acyl-CoA hydrolase
MTIQTELVMPMHVGANDRLFGGQLMSWIDIIAGIEARRYCRTRVVTACVDSLVFMGPAMLGEIIRLEAKVTWTGRTSLEVRVETFVENVGAADKLINRAYLVFVALDEDDGRLAVPPFKPESADEEAEWQAAGERRVFRLKQRKMTIF